METIGERVKALREGHGLAPAELARQAGITQPSLWAIESGATKDVKASTISGLCVALHTTADFLLHGAPEGSGQHLAAMEAELIFVIRSLPPDRRVQLLEYARFLKSQPGAMTARTLDIPASVTQLKKPTAIKKPASGKKPGGGPRSTGTD